MIPQLIEKLDRASLDERLPEHVRAAAKRDADGYRAALAKRAQS